MLSTTNTEFASIEVWFTDQNSDSVAMGQWGSHYENEIFDRTKI